MHSYLKKGGATRCLFMLVSLLCFRDSRAQGRLENAKLHTIVICVLLVNDGRDNERY
jgi:hypothetical protein